MKKLLTASIVFFALCAIMLSMSCNNGNTEKEDPSTYTLIGTWEASGEFNGAEGVNGTYTSTLTIIDDTNYTVIAHFKGPVDWTGEYEGTYTREEDKISVVNYEIQNDDKLGPSSGSFPYRFTNKNSLETHWIILNRSYITNPMFRRKS